MTATLTPANSIFPADWLTREFSGPPLLVNTFVPETFPAVIRVLNPFVGAGGRKLSWSAVAQELGIPLDGSANGENLCMEYEASTGEKVNINFGTLDPETASALADVLSQHTATPDQCYFAVWIGYSGIRDHLTKAPVVLLPPERQMYLLEGPVRAAAEAIDEHQSRRSIRWWPADKAWCVGNDLYADSVYVAGSKEATQSLRDDPRLETYVVHGSDVHPGIYASDR
ncbi:hypothetical protein [Arthrobacter sp. NPDC056493]|uniref:hypothetical protein n=1 Tax=Arthrobacter sp. NPDC056493 TaxID=3345839 RepID=UPI00366AC5BF